ncbi:MAG: ribonuclease E/G, partial [Acetivibrio ethanolgignens]
YLNCYQAEDLEKLRLYEDETTDLNRLYGIETSLSKVVAKQVWLKSGGTLVIEPTEALTVIDVNTGKAIKGNKKVQETFFKVNLEAAKEIAFQLRLRNLSGIIIVDFIDLDSEEHKKELLRALKEYLKEDPLKAVVVDMTPLGLVEITRKKLRKPLHEQLHHL